LRRLVEMFKDTVIYEEALKEFLLRDIDVDDLKRFFKAIKDGEVEFATIDSIELSPISRIAMERISRKTEVIPPERLRKILVEAAKARLLNEVRVFVCTDCWGWWKPIRILDLPQFPECLKCGSRRLAALNEDERTVKKICNKRGARLTREEESIVKEAIKQASLIERYGKLAAIALAGRRLRASDVEPILSKFKVESDAFYEKILEAERRALRRSFW